ncbi:IclR family transcriptional regulator [Salinadaptatus halalkaliphilus]|uniref:IclR family transcriptional regulator n=1 Tax=Salinadaptatus halalkaliphilus TaxID=2419781 RepID=A0A4S3TJ21_9EURY|nr:IclR family transcriptional regulator [Salinadaptatus halalkaliphilus]THE63213.1 IclR family transcriptional regulator [Salinadaptatus halalkaliphilus]
MKNEGAARVKATETTLSVIEALQTLDGGRVNEVADYLDRSPSTVHRHLNTLLSQDFVTKNGDSYQLGMKFLTVGGAVQNSDPAYRLAKSKVDELADETGERVQFLIEEHGYRYYVHTGTGSNAVETDSQIGKQGPLHCSAAGKAILAKLPESYVDEIISRYGLPAMTPNTITDKDELYTELETVRETEIAYNFEESTEGLSAIGTAVTDANESVIGGVSISGPAHRLKADHLETELTDLLLGVANELELKIKYEL